MYSHVKKHETPKTNDFLGQRTRTTPLQEFFQQLLETIGQQPQKQNESWQNRAGKRRNFH